MKYLYILIYFDNLCINNGYKIVFFLNYTYFCTIVDDKMIIDI